MQQLAQWHQTKPGLGLFAAAELALAYGFASLAIDRGSLWWYALTILFLIGGLQNLGKLVVKVLHGNKTAKA